MGMRNFNHSLFRRDGNLIIFTEPSGVIEPGKGAFHQPTPREFFPLMGLNLLRNIHIKVKLFPHIGNKRSSISSIRTKPLDRRIPPTRPFCGGYPTFCIMDIGGMNHDRQQAAQRVYDDVSFSAFRFFPPSIPRSSLAATVFTLWESMIA